MCCVTITLILLSQCVIHLVNTKIKFKKTSKVKQQTLVWLFSLHNSHSLTFTLLFPLVLRAATEVLQLLNISDLIRRRIYHDGHGNFSILILWFVLVPGGNDCTVYTLSDLKKTIIVYTSL